MKTKTVNVEYELAYDEANNRVWAKDGLKNVVIYYDQFGPVHTTLAARAAAFYEECRAQEPVTKTVSIDYKLTYYPKIGSVWCDGARVWMESQRESARTPLEKAAEKFYYELVDTLAQPR